VCAHSPISANDCKPNRSLRLTVKAFIKSEEKKRDKEKASAAGCAILPPPSTIAAPPATPLTATAEQIINGSEVGIKATEVDSPLQSSTNGKAADSFPVAASIEEQDVSFGLDSLSDSILTVP
jgi:hypothetical protein